MAVLNKIRQRSFFLIMIIALALFAFIIGDLLKGGGFGGQKATKTIGEVNGEEINTAEFQAAVDAQRGRGSSIQTVRNVWNQKVNDILMSQRAEDAGLVVNSEHLNAELAKRYAGDPSLQEDGQFSMAKLQELIYDMKENDKARYANWTSNEGEIARQVAQQRYISMVKAGVGATIKEGELAYKAENDKVNIKYVQLPYSAIDDKEVEISKTEITSYINAHKSEFERNAYTDVEYVKIDEVATLEDEKAIISEVAKLKNDKEEFNKVSKQTDTVRGFVNAENIEEFFEDNNSSIAYNKNLRFKSQLSKEVIDNLFDDEVGTVYGPYKDDGYIKLSKLVAESKMPDSAKASHILIAWKGLQSGGPDITLTKENAKKLADSILTVISKKDKEFTTLAATYSSDNSNKFKGGDLGYFTPGRMVPAFNDFVFKGEEGDKGIVETQFGYHVIKVEEQKNIQKAIKVATYAQKIEPSEKTINEIYAKATKFRIDADKIGFTEAAKEANLTIKPTTKMGELDENIPELGAQRQIVRWAFEEETKLGATKNFDLPSGYVITKLTNREEKGLMNSEEASSKVLPILRNKKKAELLKAKISGSDLNEIAKANNTTVKSASAITMKNATISGAGIEKKIVGTAFGLEINEVSKPIAGEKGVYVVQSISKTPGQGLASYQGLANEQGKEQARKAQSALLAALKEKAEITDKRAVMY